MLFCSYIENENNNFLFFKVFADKLNLNISWKFTFVTMLISNCFPQIWSKLATIKLPLHRIPFIKLQFIQSGVMVSHIYRNSIWKNVYCSKWILFQGFYCLEWNVIYVGCLFHYWHTAWLYYSNAWMNLFIYCLLKFARNIEKIKYFIRLHC